MHPAEKAITMDPFKNIWNTRANLLFVAASTSAVFRVEDSFSAKAVQTKLPYGSLATQTEIEELCRSDDLGSPKNSVIWMSNGQIHNQAFKGSNMQTSRTSKAHKRPYNVIVGSEIMSLYSLAFDPLHEQTRALIFKKKNPGLLDTFKQSVFAGSNTGTMTEAQKLIIVRKFTERTWSFGPKEHDTRVTNQNMVRRLQAASLPIGELSSGTVKILTETHLHSMPTAENYHMNLPKSVEMTKVGFEHGSKRVSAALGGVRLRSLGQQRGDLASCDLLLEQRDAVGVLNMSPQNPSAQLIIGIADLVRCGVKNHKRIFGQAGTKLVQLKDEGDDSHLLRSIRCFHVHKLRSQAVYILNEGAMSEEQFKYHREFLLAFLFKIGVSLKWYIPENMMVGPPLSLLPR